MKVWEIIKKENINCKYKDSRGNTWRLDYSMDLVSDDYTLIEVYYKLNELLLLEFEKEFDWRKVPVDTKILVSNTEGLWVKRMFAKYEDGKIHAWNAGKNSYTADDEEDVSVWFYAKINEENI